MRILTNPGSNLDDDDTDRWDIDLFPQKIIVDGISFDTRGTIDFAKIDSWVKKSLKHPVTQGTNESDALGVLSSQARRDPDLLCVMTSRKIIGSFEAVSAAAKKVPGAHIEVVDTGATDVGAGLCTLAAVQARKAGLSLADTATFVRAFAARQRNIIGLHTLEHLIKSGRANFLQGWAANFLNIRPIIQMEDGVIVSAGKVSAKADLPEKLAEQLTAKLERGTSIWLGIAHGNAPEKAAALAARLRDAYRCEYVLIRPLSTSIYLNAGPGALCAFLYPLDGLPLRLTPP